MLHSVLLLCNVKSGAMVVPGLPSQPHACMSFGPEPRYDTTILEVKLGLSSSWLMDISTSKQKREIHDKSGLKFRPTHDNVQEDNFEIIKVDVLIRYTQRQ